DPRAAPQHAVARERDVGHVQVVRGDAVLGLEAPRDRHREPGVEERRDRAAVHRAEGTHEGLGHVHAEHRLGLVPAFDREAEQLPESRQAGHRRSWRAKRPAYTAVPSQRWRTIWQRRTPAWMVSGCFATLDISRSEEHTSELQS